MKYKIAILDNVNLLPDVEKQLQLLANEPLIFPKEIHTTEQELIERTGNAKAVLINPWSKITESYLNACPTVKYIGLCGTSTANIDLKAVKKRGIVLTNVVGHGDEPAAEYMFMQLLMLARGEHKYMWHKVPCELMGKSIGIIGLGAVGKTFANLALGLKMKVHYFSLHRKYDWEKLGVKYLNLKSLLSICEIIVITTPTNVKILGKKEFSLIQPNSVLIYTSTGEALDKEAFIEWVKNNSNYAIFNYSAGENYYQAFKDLPRVIFPKVVAGYTFETRQRLGNKVIENLKNYIAGAN